MADQTLESLFARYSADGDIDALAEVFDRVAPDLERLARRLTRDRSRAEDLVQATFLGALERPGTFEEGRALRPWLLGILVHRASAERRRDALRPEPDRLESCAVESPNVLSSEAETRAVVTRAIADLPQSLRAVVEGRLLQEKDTLALAEELAISHGTLRVRLHRGLERLRRALPPGLATAFAAVFIHSRGLAQVRSHVLQEATRHVAVTQSATVSIGAAATGTVLMSKKLILVAAATTALLGTVLFQVLPRGTKPSPPVLHGMEELAAPDAQPVTVQEELSQRAEVATQSSADPVAADGEVLVSVVRADGSPAVGFAVEVGYRGEPSIETSQQVTGDEGLARFRFPAGTELFTAEVTGTETTALQRKRIDQTLAGGEQLAVQLNALDGWPVSGRVVDEAGRGVAGAEVLAWSASKNYDEPDRIVRANADGEFRVEHLGPEFVITARAKGLACKLGLRGGLSARVEAEGLTVSMAPARSMHGVVRGPDRRPIEGATVSYSNGLNRRSSANETQVAGVTTFSAGNGRTATDAEGRFELTGIPRTRQGIGARKAPYVSHSAIHPTGDEPVEINLERGQSLRGTVYDAEGHPAVGAGVQLQPRYAYNKTTPDFMRCDENGAFEFFGVPPDFDRHSPSIRIEFDGHATHIVKPVTPGPNGGAPITVRLQRERVVSGIVVDMEGRPVPGVHIWLEREREPGAEENFTTYGTWVRINRMGDRTTDEEGRFRFGKLDSGDYTLHALSPDDERASIMKLTRLQGDELRFVLDPAVFRKVALLGQVRDSRTGTPITKFSVHPMVGSFSMPKSFESTDGKFEFSGLPVGPIEVQVNSPGYATRILGVRHYTEGDHHLEFALVPARSLEVTVVDQKGEPYLYGDVEAFNLQGRMLMLGRVGAFRSSSRQLLDSRAMLHGLPGERFTLRISVGVKDERNVHDFAVDLTQPYEGPYELVIPRESRETRESARLFVAVFVLDAGANEAEARDLLEAPGMKRGREWLETAFASELIAFPDQTVHLDVEEGGRQLARATLTPSLGVPRVFAIETSSMTDYWGGRSTGREGTHELPVPVLMFDALPVKTVQLAVTCEGYRNVLKDFRLIAGSAKPEIQYVLLVRD